ncbi:MAG: hypothetical protein MUC29_08810 [Pyrinomonadaceae bacterium]|nr:hypothetical protein [Pyrinomonadaceae bacterium]
MDLNEIWQVDVSGQIYEANLEELKQWIIEGAVLRDDKIRRGNLRWLEAGKIPFLIESFNLSPNGGMPQFQSTVTHANVDDAPVNMHEAHINMHDATVNSHKTHVNMHEAQGNLHEAHANTHEAHANTHEAHANMHKAQANLHNTSANSHVATTNFNPQTVNTTQAKSNVVKKDVCFSHPDVTANYVCETCSNEFCGACPKTYGSVKICPVCGAMCKSKKELQQKNTKQVQYSAALNQGFGFGDFVQALGYPLKNPMSLVFGGFAFGLLSIAQNAFGMGSMFLAGAGIVCIILANAITFGCLSNTINEFSQGRLDSNFLPSFDDFDILESVVKPFFLSIGVYLVTFGLFIAVIIGGVFLVMNSVSKNAQNLPNFGQPQIILPNQVNSSNPSDVQVSVYPVEDGNPSAMPNQTQKSPVLSPQVQNSLDDLKKKDIEQKRKIAELMGKEDKMSPQEFDREYQKQIPTANDMKERANLEEQQIEELNNFVNDYQKKRLESVIGETPETKQAMQAEMFKNLMNYGFWFLLVMGIALLWAIFYYPAACLVAGYTEEISAVINPLVGLDTIRRLGGTYIKILLMYFLLGILAVIPMGIVSIVLSPFDMPKVGNIPATFINSIIYFYFYIVFAAVLGLAVYKKSDKLAIKQY